MRFDMRAARVNCFAAGLFVAFVETGQTQEKEQPVTPVVVRISHDLLNDLADDEIEETIAVHDRLAGGQVWGNVLGKAKLDVEMIEDGDEADFVIRANGTASGHLCGKCGCFRATGVVCVPFTVVKTVRFADKKFYSESKQVRTTIHGRLTSLRTRRDGPLGKIVSGATQPIVKGMIPELTREATPIANRYLSDFVQEEADSIITELNQITPFEETIMELYPETKDWPYRLSTTETHLQLAIGPAEARLASLPVGDKLPKQAGMEVWIRSTPEEARFLEALATWETANDLLREYLSDQPEVQQLVEDAKVTAVKEWVVISVGLPAE